MNFLILIVAFGQNINLNEKEPLRVNLNNFNDSELTKVVMRFGEKVELQQLKKISDSFT